jgi:hypothetical protein
MVSMDFRDVISYNLFLNEGVPVEAFEEWMAD